jgi:cytochrome c-type biogenesis protein CcmH
MSEAGTRVTRRGFLVALAASATLAAAERLRAQTPGSAAGAPPAGSLPGSGPAGSLGDPAAAGRPQAATTARDDDAAIQAIEKRLRCTCGCTLDVYTCRTTDFSCTYSPQLHREVLGLRDSGMTGQQIVDAFVAKYGEQALMAPRPEGFNLAGYLLPGSLVAAAGGVMLWILSRRRLRTAQELAPVAVDATPEELERLRQALAEGEGP